MVRIFGEAMLKDALESVTKQSTKPDVTAPLEKWRAAYLIADSAAPEAVKARPIVLYVNLYCFAEAPTVHWPVAGGSVRPPAREPPAVAISLPMELNLLRVESTRMAAL